MKGRKRFRKRTRSKKPYFGKDVHNSIVKYQNTPLIEDREKIYVDEILPAFNKLCENLIFIHKFAQSKEEYELLKNDCVTFLFETLNKFDPSRGTKAFSYFNVVAKNWLIIQAKKKAKQRSKMISIDDEVALSMNDSIAIESYSIAPSQDYAMIKRDALKNLFELMGEIKKRLKSENEISCMNAVITLFTKIEDLDLLLSFNISGLNPKQLSVAMSTIRKHYRDLSRGDDFDIFF